MKTINWKLYNCMYSRDKSIDWVFSYELGFYVSDILHKSENYFLNKVLNCIFHYVNIILVENG